eukprot:2018866-Amphidinium_carterae.1
MYGSHLLKFVSATQQPIALSTAESEYYALIREAAVAIGCANMALDMGISLGVKLHGDAIVASGVGHRRGAGRIRHIGDNQ